jgi:hypothetical protein
MKFLEFLFSHAWYIIFWWSIISLLIGFFIPMSETQAAYHGIIAFISLAVIDITKAVK